MKYLLRRANDEVHEYFVTGVNTAGITVQNLTTGNSEFWHDWFIARETEKGNLRDVSKPMDSET